MANDSDVARVAAAMNAPGFRYRSFGNEPVRVRPASVEASSEAAPRRASDRFVPLPEPEPMPAPDELLQPFDNREERFSSVVDTTTPLGAAYTPPEPMPELDPVPPPLPLPPLLAQPLVPPMPEPMPANLSIPASILPSLAPAPAPFMAPEPPLPAPAPAALTPIFSWPDTPPAVEPAPAVDSRAPFAQPAFSQPAFSPPPLTTPPAAPAAEAPAEPLAMRGAPSGGFRLLESIGHRGQDDGAPRVVTAGGTLGMLRQAIEGGTGAPISASALGGMAMPAEMSAPAGLGGGQTGGLLPAATVTVPLSDVMRLIAAGATPPPSPFDAFRVALGAQSGR